MGNTNLSSARINANDEFYTLIDDISKELNYYRDEFKGKHIFMNCDDPEESHFWKYFKLNFDFLGLSKITSTYYHPLEPTYRLDYDGKKIIKTPLEQNGDFRSPEAIEILMECDIVVTNPPFSLFREYIAQLIEYDKSFIVIGNMNAITYKEIFPLLKDNKIWLGQNNGVMEFVIPENSPEKSGQRIDENGIRYQKFGNIAWYTNMNAPRRNEEIVLYEHYSKEKYPEYDNYKAVNVDRVSQIPKDYCGIMGVPITFLGKHSPKQFEIIWTTDRGGDGYLEDIKKPHDRYDAPVVDGVGKYKRILIKRKQ